MRKAFIPFFRFLPILSIASAVIIFFYPFFFLGKVFFFGDNFSLFVPNLIFWKRSILNGEFPLWNPNLFSGVPYLADVITGVFYPLYLIFFVTPISYGFTLMIILEIFLAGFFTYIFCREIHLSKIAGILSAIVFMFCASLTTYVNNFTLVNSTIYLPLILFFLERAISRKSLFWAIGASVATTLSIFGGHLQPVYYSIVLAGVYLLFRSGVSIREKIKSGVLWGLVTAGFSAVVFLPFLEMSKLTTRAQFSFDYVAQDSLQPIFLIRLILPHFFSFPAEGISWGPAWRLVADNTGYFGVTLIVLISIFLISGRKRNFFTWFFAISSLISLILALGKFTPLYYIFYKLLPYFGQFRAPTQIFLIFNFCIAILAGISFDWILEDKTFGKRIVGFFKNTKIFLILFFFLSFLGFIISKFRFEWISRVVAILYRILKHRELVESAFHNQLKDQVISILVFRNMVLTSGLMVLTFILFYLFLSKKVTKKVFSVIFLVLVFADLFIFNRNNFFWGDRSVYDVSSPFASYLSKTIRPEDRVLSSSENSPYTGLSVYWENMVFREPFVPSVFDTEEQKNYSILKHRVSILAPNWGEAKGLGTINGYGSMVLSEYDKYLRSRTSANFNINYVDPIDYFDDRLNTLGVSYIVFDTSLGEIPKDFEKRYSLVFEADGGRIYRNPNAYPRAFVTGLNEATRSAARIVEYKVNEVQVEAKARESEKLVLTDMYYPGWKVWVNGKSAEIKPYQKVFRSVDLDKGDNKVLFRFEPLTVAVGALISLATVFSILGGIFWSQILRGKSD